MLDTSKTTPVVGDGVEPDLRIYNVIAYFGYVESWRHAPLIFQNIAGGFTDPKEALLDLHECLASCVSEMRDPNKSIDNPIELEECIQELLLELQSSTNDDHPGGYEFYQDLEQCGWTFQGKLVTGVAVTITESAEIMLANKSLIEKHVDAFNGKTVFWPHGPEMSSDIEFTIQIISNIPSKQRESK